MDNNLEREYPMEKIKKFFSDIPLGIVNLVTVASGIGTILTTIIAIIELFRGEKPTALFLIIALLVSLLFNLILFMKVRKYSLLEQSRMQVITLGIHSLHHTVRDLYFDVIHNQRKKILNAPWLTQMYKNELMRVLDNLCHVMKAYTARDVSACIKLITDNDDDAPLDAENATLITFCRSPDSEGSRNGYESKINAIPIKDNTDFYEVVSKDYEKDYFYQTNLVAYDELLHKSKERYRNTNADWKLYYQSTIVVPIRISFNKLYHQKKKDEHFHIIGFLCIDSLATDAFTEKQEKYNVAIMNAYADLLYILLSQYRYYLGKLA